MPKKQATDKEATVVRCELSEDVHAWERQPEEEVLWYSRFLLYLDQGATKRRSVVAAYQAHLKISGLLDKNGRHVKSGKQPIHVPGAWRQKAKFWRWEDRADIYDSFNNAKHLEGYQKRRSMQRIAWLEELERKEWEASRLLYNRAKEMLNYPLVTQVVSEHGRSIVIEPARWTLADAAKFLQAFSALARSAASSKEMEPLEALQVLIDAGWIPPEVYEVADAGLADIAEAVRRSLMRQKDNPEEEG